MTLPLRALTAAALLAACGPKTPTTTASPPPPPISALPSLDQRLELVESFPVETSLDTPEFREAADVWVELIDAATTTLDVGEFYISPEDGKKLDPVIVAIDRAAARGVAVRVLADKKFSDTYPAVLAGWMMGGVVGVRVWNGADLAGGVHHAKYFVVDDKVTYLGSQNFDWRSLEHIQELGVVIRDEAATGFYSDVFETDWGLAGNAAKADRVHESAAMWPATWGEGDGALTVTPVASPTGWLPDESLWDLPKILDLLNGAERAVRVQLMTYATSDRSGEAFPDLDDALRAAAKRGVAVEILVADWSKRSWSLEPLRELAKQPNITVKFLVIPAAAEGYIPYARVAHAKYLVVDGQRAWLGTSNWGRDYFYDSRNVGLIVDGASFAGRLDAFFARNWASEYAEGLDPAGVYQPPRIGE